jgi:TolB-like protein/DNA-binding SARP family transcriptional activator/Tfp pilus assembly protein PilF
MHGILGIRHLSGPSRARLENAMSPSSSRNPRIHVVTLGGLRIECDGDEVVDLLAQPVRCALFLYLALERSATRDALMAHLWPERDAERARHSLSQTLYELRRRLGEGWVESRGERLDVAAGVTVDALEFAGAVEAGRDEDALALYRGAFLEGSHPGASLAFEDWVDRRRSQLDRMHRDLCRRLTAARIEQGDAGGALAVARRWAEVDPLEDEAHHRIIELLAESGRRLEALRHYDAYRDLIARELAVEPLDQTEELAARLREGGAPTAGPPEPIEPGSGSAPAAPTAEPSPDPAADAPPDAAPAGRAVERPVERPVRGRRVLAALPSRWWLLAPTLAIVGGVVVWGGANRVASGSDSAGGALNPLGVAVLPFLNLSQDPEQEYFADGIMEDVLTALARIADLTVISRTSVMQYKGTTRMTRQIAEELGVAHLLEGSVRRDGDRVRVSAQLIDARTDAHLWAQTFDRNLTDIFAIQSEIAQQIATALRVRITPSERERLAGRPTASLVAYDLYLLAREHLGRRTMEDNETAIALFRRAVELDPAFARAYAGIAHAYTLRVNHYAQGFAWADSAVHLAREALALDPELPDGYDALAGAYYVQGHFGSAREPAERAVHLDPNNARALNTLGNLKVEEGRLAEALGHFRRVVVVDPARAESSLRNTVYIYVRVGAFERAEELAEQISARWPENLGTVTDAAVLPLFQGRYEEAKARSRRLVTRFPTYAGSWMLAGDAHLFSGDIQQASENYARAYDISPWGYYPVYPVRLNPVTLGFTLWKTGKREEAEALFREVQELAGREIPRGMDVPALRYNLAAVYAIQGEKAEALRWLEEAVELGWSDHIWLSRDPLFENLRDDDRFLRLVERNRQRMAVQRQFLEQERW